MKILKHLLQILLLISFVSAYGQDDEEIQKMKDNTKQFSQWYMNANYKAMSEAYTMDGKIFPDRTKIIEGRQAIEERWKLPENVKILNHVVHPEEIEIVGNTAYDYGYYEGTTKLSNGEVTNWKGKYVIVWKKIEDDWKMYLDIWNRVDEPEN